MSDTPYMVKQTITFSDGSETVINFTDNPNRAEIEAAVAEAVAGDHKVSRDVFEVVEAPVIEEEAPKAKRVKKEVVEEE